MRKLLNVFASLFLLISIVIAGDVLLGFLGFHKTQDLLMGDVVNKTAGAQTEKYISPVALKTTASVPSVLAVATAAPQITTASVLKAFSWEEILTNLRAYPEFHFSEDVQFDKDLNVGGSSYIENDLEIGEKLKVHDDAKIKGNLTVEGEKISINGEKYIFPDEHGVGSLTNDGNGNLSWASIANSTTTFLGLSDTPSSYTGSESKIVRVNGAGTALEFVDLSSLGVTSVTNSDGTLTISPTTGAVVASLNLGNANIWTAIQTFTANSFFGSNSVWNSSGNIGIGVTATNDKLTIAGGNLIQTAFGSPTLLASLDTSGDTRNLYISGRYAYLADGAEGLQIIDISNPSSPVLVNTYNPGSTSALSVFVSGDYAYVGYLNDGLYIVDISNPQSPVLLSNYNPAGIDSMYSIHLSGNYLYAATESLGLMVFDVGNKSNPILVGTSGTPGIAVDVFVQGSYAYVAGGEDGGIQVIDISDPANPVLTDSDASGVDGQGIYVSGRYAYLGDGSGGLDIYDISDPTDISLVGTYAVNVWAEGIAVAGDYIYVTDYTAGLVVLDGRNPSTPALVGTYNTSGTARDVIVAGKYAYVADSSSGLQIIDINGIKTPGIYAGSTYTDTLSTTGNINAGNDLYVRNGLMVGVGGASFSGGVGIGTSSASGAFSVSQYAAGDILNLFSGSTEVFTVLSNGNVGIGTSDPGSKLSIANLGTGTGTTLVIDSNGNVFKDSSSERYKMNIEPLSVDFEKVLELQPKEYDFKDSGIHTIGYIAEEVEELGGLQDLLIYDAQGRVDGFKYDRLPIYTLEIVKGLNERVESLEERVSNLEANSGVLGDSDEIYSEDTSDYYGIIVVDEDGDVGIENNLEVRGLLRAAKINISENSEAVGKAKIPAGDTFIEVGSATLTQDSIIFVTPDSPVTISAKKIDYDKFEVKLDKAYDFDVNVNWIVIN